MTDPFGAAFDALRAEDQTVRPDPDFTARLRARIERALNLPRGVAVSQTVTAPAQPSTTQIGPLGAAVPYLAVRDARAAITWYVEAFGAEVSYDPILMPDGRIGHCELSLAGGLVYLADEHPEIGVVAPSPGAAAVSLMLGVDDADRVRSAAMERGATGDREVYDAHGQRNAWIVDPFGHRWGLHSPLPATTAAADATSAGTGQGDVVYASVQAPDPGRAAAFYRAVLGWEVSGEGSRYPVSGQALSLAIYGESERPGLFLCYGVDDLAAAVDRVRSAGGTTGEPQDRPYGPIADCVDDQGMSFALNELPGGTGSGLDAAGAGAGAGADPGPVAAADGSAGGPGDLAYLTYLVPDSGRFRDFYGAVLGWSFSPGRVEDGWQISGTTPMGGIAGGSDRPVAVPMWQVEDLAAAAEQVRAAGGTAGQPERQPYGLMCECSDDQGIAFYLGQF